MRGRRAGRHKNMRKRRTRKVGGNMPVGPCRLLAPPRASSGAPDPWRAGASRRKCAGPRQVAFTRAGEDKGKRAY